MTGLCNADAESMPRASGPGFNLQQDRNFQYPPGTRIRSDAGAKPQSLISAHIPRLNSKFLRSVFSVKTYALLKAIHPSDRDVEPGGPLVFSIRAG